jgi:tRNA(fMet)-specific endonuclease VapC
VAVILDTSAVSALLAGDAALSDVLGSDPIHHLPVIVIGEYRYGVARSKHRPRLERVLELLVRQSIVLDVDEETTRHYGTIRENLLRAGSPIPENDVWIAALALQHGEAIVSRDHHFDLVDPSLRIAW